jgi:hypothetical protein
MSTDRRIGSKVPDFIRREDSPGIRFDSGPYIGKIKNNLDPTMSGRLQVWIPDLGAEEENQLNWRTVSYASPFFGATPQSQSKNKGYADVRHTYGMWFTVPDVDNFVLCTFVAGDPLRGFWFGCIPAQLGHHMVPAIGGSKNKDESNIKDSTVQQAEKGPVVPVAEFSEIAVDSWENFAKVKKPIHEDHFRSIVEQGLNKDTTRGIITSTSQRESPSTVFGISTPGRPLNEDGIKVYGRKGGHTFVMDDGDYQDKNRMVRLRSSAGHQIMFNDSDEVMHIINSKGTVWIELDKEGSLNVYAEKDLNIRAKGDFNLHSDKNMYIHAEGSFNLCAKKEMNIEANSLKLATTETSTIYGSKVEIGASGEINLNPGGGGSFSCGGELILKGSQIKLNSGDGPTVNKPDPITVNNHADTEKQGVNWKSQGGKIKSVVKRLTSHEPWPRDVVASASPSASSAASAAGIANNAGTNTTPSTAGSGSTASPGFGNTTGAVQSTPNGVEVTPNGQTDWPGPAGSQDPGLVTATGKAVKNPVDPSYMYRSDNPNPTRGVGNLNETQVKAVKTQLAWSESRYNYGATEAVRGNYLGKYQMGAGVLTTQGYIKPDAYARYGTAAVQYPSSWTNKDGINSKEAFLSNASVQERSMDNLLASNYRSLVNNGGIKPTDDPSTVGGMLSSAHLLGATGAKNWRNSGNERIGDGADANGTTGSTYFNAGRYAVNTLGGRGSS